MHGYVCVCVRDINCSPVSTIFRLHFETVLTVWYFLFLKLLLTVKTFRQVLCSMTNHITNLMSKIGRHLREYFSLIVFAFVMRYGELGIRYVEISRSGRRQIDCSLLFHIYTTYRNNGLEFCWVFALYQFTGMERHSESCVDVKASTSVRNCINYYLNQTTLSFEPTIQNCSGAYMKANEMLSSVCTESNDTDNCNVNISEIISEHPRCFQSNTLRVDYSCECKCLCYFSFIKKDIDY